jgi:hypothetical protein
MRYLSKQNKINRQVQDKLKRLRETQSHQQTMISTLQAVVLSIQNTAPTTPLSQIRHRKKQKSKTSETRRTQEEAKSDSETDDLHQLRTVANILHNIPHNSVLDTSTMDVDQSTM